MAFLERFVADFLYGKIRMFHAHTIQSLDGTFRRLPLLVPQRLF